VWIVITAIVAFAIAVTLGRYWRRAALAEATDAGEQWRWSAIAGESALQETLRASMDKDVQLDVVQSEVEVGRNTVVGLEELLTDRERDIEELEARIAGIARGVAHSCPEETDAVRFVS